MAAISSAHDGPLHGPVILQIVSRHVRGLERRVELGASYQFQEGWLDKWALSGTYAHVHNDANLSIYRYDRDLVQVTIGRSY